MGGEKTRQPKLSENPRLRMTLTSASPPARSSLINVSLEQLLSLKQLSLSRSLSMRRTHEQGKSELCGQSLLNLALTS